VKWWQGLVLLGLAVAVIWVAGERFQSDEAERQKFSQAPASEASRQERSDEAQGKTNAQGETEMPSSDRIQEGEGVKLELGEVDTQLPRDAAGAEEGLAVGRQAPDFRLLGMDGQTYQLRDLRGKKPVVVNFWASWCPPCELEAPDLVYLYGKYKEQVEIFAVNLTVRDTLEDAQAFARRYGFEFPILLDQKGNVARAYQVLSIPTSYFIDKEGVIRHKLIGVTTRGRLEAMFQKLIHEKNEHEP
jgi:peroxiredoxin